MQMPSGSPAPAAKASAAPAPAPAPSSAPASVVDSLLETDAKITVSSRVDNPMNYPEHLVDGRPETAWNGKTGDLQGWIEVVSPPEVRVTSLAITLGFDKKKGKDDSFTMNHRIAKLRILRDGAIVVKEATLDTSRRDLQHIPIALEATGGTWRIEVLETLPGTKKEWKELVVSDLKMFGIAGAARLPSPRLPKVAVAPGSAPPPAPITGVDAVVGEGRFATSPACVVRRVHRRYDARHPRGGPGLDDEGSLAARSRPRRHSRARCRSAGARCTPWSSNASSATSSRRRATS